MSSSLNYNKLLGNNSVYTPNFTKQNAINRSHTLVTLPCVPVHEPVVVLPDRPNDGADRPNFGNQRNSSAGLARTKDHPTNLPLMPRFDGYKTY